MKKHECLKRAFDVGAVNRANNKYMWRMVKGRPVGSRERYLWSGISKHDLKDYNGAIADHTKAIDVSPNYADAHEWRGNAKYDLEDYSGAIADYTKAIDINPNEAWPYVSRGNAKYDLEDYNGAIADYTKSIYIHPNFRAGSIGYYNRGISKEKLGDLNGACADWGKAVELGDTDAAQLVANHCN